MPGPKASFPKTLRHYRLLRELGSGGMGIVVEGVDRRDDTRVAVKLLRTELAASDPSYLERFEREAHIVTLLHSPYAVRLQDFGVENGQYFLVMEFVEGQTLADAMREGPMEPERALRIASEVGRALEEAGIRGVVHRDIKPENILLDNEDRAKVTDFGIARQEAAPGLTLAGLFAGTPAYAAPEQLEGRADQRTDVYQLGGTLYHALAGRAPFVGHTTNELLRMQREDALPMGPLAHLPDQVLNVLRRCLEKDPLDRYASATDLVGALDRARNSLLRQGYTRPSRVAPPPLPSAPSTPGSRRPAWRIRSKTDPPSLPSAQTQAPSALGPKTGTPLAPVPVPQPAAEPVGALPPAPPVPEPGLTVVPAPVQAAEELAPAVTALPISVVPEPASTAVAAVEEVPVRRPPAPLVAAAAAGAAGAAGGGGRVRGKRGFLFAILALGLLGAGGVAAAALVLLGGDDDGGLTPAVIAGASPTATTTGTATAAPTENPSATASSTTTGTATATASGTPADTATPAHTATPAATPTPLPAGAAPLPTPTPTPTPTPNPTSTPPPPTDTPTRTPSPTPSPTPEPQYIIAGTFSTQTTVQSNTCTFGPRLGTPLTWSWNFTNASRFDTRINPGERIKVFDYTINYDGGTFTFAYPEFSWGEYITRGAGVVGSLQVTVTFSSHTSLYVNVIREHYASFNCDIDWV